VKGIRFSVVERLAVFLAFYQLPSIFINWTKQIGDDMGDLFFGLFGR
jgi:hypothetical protein